MASGELAPKPSAHAGPPAAVSQSNMAIQTSGPEDNEDDHGSREELEDDGDVSGLEASSDGELALLRSRRRQGRLQQRQRRQRSISLNDILESSFVHESANGERIIISRGWPSLASPLPRSQQHSSKQRHGRAHRRHHSRRRHEHLSGRRQPEKAPSPSTTMINGRPANLRRPSATTVISLARRNNKSGTKLLNEDQKRQLLMEFLQRTPQEASANLDAADLLYYPVAALSSTLDVESALNIHRNSSRLTNYYSQLRAPTSPQDAGGEEPPNGGAPPGTSKVSAAASSQQQQATKRLVNGSKRSEAKKAMIQQVQYDLQLADGEPIAL